VVVLAAAAVVLGVCTAVIISIWAGTVVARQVKIKNVVYCMSSVDGVLISIT